MALHAIDDVSDAIDVTREFLFPFELRRWLKLAIVAFFIGGTTSAPTANFNTGGTPSDTPGQQPGQFPDGIPSTLPDDFLLIVGLVVAVLLVIGLAFAIIGSIMEFVFIESLRSGEVSIRRYWNRRWGQGLRLFGFRFAIGLPFLLLVVGWLALLLVPLLTGNAAPGIAAFLIGIPLIFIAALVYGVIDAFTTAFVVPLMIQNDSGVLAAWGRLWTSVKSAWKQYIAYALVAFGLGIVAAFLLSIVVGIGAVIVAIPFAILGGITYLTLSFSPAGLVIIGVLAAIFVVAVIVLTALVQVPVLAYLRYYALLVLGDIEPDFDLIPDRRPVDDE
ncbi:hypothetical protein [Natronomonas gomsonensis]|uniref:DUF7544 domain-containing protein n=1 Tax=Natronomonas gomsonensis TaxID=1046043 RepID=UPI0015BAA551|nr:hypothetical protein [Natronomonas gomsonensis]